MSLSAAELERYSRHLVLPQIGVAGQLRLKQSSALIVGAGGLGSPAALYLAAAGVGRIGVVDHDLVDLTNLQRQILHDSAAIGRSKTDSARARLVAANPNVTVEAHTARLNVSNARSLLRAYDVVLDCTDNFATRYLINDAAILETRSVIFASVYRFEGQLTVFRAGGRPCYRCMHPVPPVEGSVPNCAEGGVLGVLPGVMGSLQATEALKLLLNIGDSMAGRLLLFDSLALRFREIALRADDACTVCSESAAITGVTMVDATCAIPIGEHMNDITSPELNQKLQQGERLQVVDVREQQEWDAGHLQGAKHIPLGELPARVGELDEQAATIVYCRSGGRSARAAMLLRQSGFADVQNLAGGLTAWSREIDPTVRVV